MPFSELTVLLPCHSLEDFPVYYEGHQADELLAAWCAPWHPALVAAAGALPTWHRIDLPPESLTGRLMVAAPSYADQLPAGYAARALTEGGRVVAEPTLAAAVAAATDGLAEVDQLDPEFTADFLALAYCRLQIELLTRQMRYSVNIDDIHFERESVSAARAAVAGDLTTAREHLAQCFSTLLEARQRFYPVDVYLIDLTLTAPTTLGAPLVHELASGTPTNLLASLDVWRDLAADQPEVWSRVLSAIDAATAYVVGGELIERELPLLPLERVRQELTAGVRQYEALIGRTPYVYARRRAGLWPGLPQMLVKLGYQGALHFTLDDGRFPLGPQAKIRWEGIDTSTLDVVARVPDDAAKSETYLALSRKMADSMDNDHVATLLFAHWPGAVNPWHDVLRRITRLSPVLGKFVLLDDYFSHTDMPGRLSKFGPDEYRSPYLKQAIVRRQANALSSIAAEHQASVVANAASALGTIYTALSGQLASDPVAETDPVEHLTAEVDRLAAIFPRGAGSAAPRVLVVNPLSFARRIGVTLPQGAHAPAVAAPVVAAADTATGSYAVVDVPAMGFAWITPATAAGPSKRGPKPIARDNLLTNEFFELSIGPKTGGIATLFDFNRRGKQLSQQLAFRLPGVAPEPGSVWRGDDEPSYTAMRAESIEITVASAAFGEITSRGALIDADGRRWAGFVQRTQVWAGSRVIGLEIELTDVEDPRADPWNSYYAARFAWSSHDAELVRGVNLARQRTEATRIEAPEYIDLDSSAGHVTILSGGLPYHLRIGDRMLDSLLVVRGETARKFRLGIGVDLPQPAAAAVELLAPTTVWQGSTPPPAAGVGWFFHLDAKNIVATHWEPLTPDQAGNGQGFRVRLLETTGRPGRVSLRAYRPVISARQVDLQGQTLVQVPVEGDRLTLDFAAYEWIEVEAVWKP